MLFTNLALLLIPTSALAFADKALHEQSRSRARQHYARVHANETVGDVEKRGDSYNGRATFYDVELGACGWYNVRSDYIVAQNSAQFGSSYPSQNCGKSITISYGGNTATATIADECPTCDYGSLDFSRSLFDHFASEDVGQFQMTWWYNDGSNNQQTTTTSQTPTSTWVAPTSTYTPPTSTYTPPTSTYVAPTTTSTTPSIAIAITTSASTSTSSSTLSSTYTTPPASTITSLAVSLTLNGTSTIPFDAITTEVNVSAIASTTGTSSADPASVTGTTEGETLGNLVYFNQAVAYLGHIVVVGAGGK